jgi:GNAT superfamily N-acetyltransferase
MSSDPVVVRKVENDADFKVFFEFPWTIYKGDPNWVPPLLSIRKKLLDKKRNPSWEYLEGDYFVAWRGKRPVGTITAFINHRHNETWDEKIGWFGLFETHDDREVANALLQTAVDWVKAKGPYTAIRGPAQFTCNDEWGVLIENFSRPVLLYPYNHPYYQRLIEDSGLGYDKIMELYAWYSNPAMIQSEGSLPAKLVRVVEKTKERNGITIRKPDPKRLKEELNLLREIYEVAWEKNWGNVPPTQREIDALFHDLKDYFDPELARFAYVKGKPAGFFLALPDMNEVLHRAYPRPGEPEIWTLLKALWHWKIRPKIKGQRILLLGVKPEFRRMGVDAAMNLSFAQERLSEKYWDTDAGWMLETNQAMNQFMASMKGILYKRYRIYQKALG